MCLRQKLLDCCFYFRTFQCDINIVLGRSNETEPKEEKNRLLKIHLNVNENKANLIRNMRMCCY